MQNKATLLSICFPIYNRLLVLETTLKAVLQQVEEIASQEVEVIVSVNASEDGEERVSRYVQELALKYPIKTNYNATNIGGVFNIMKTIEMARGKFIWIIGDDDLVLPGGVKFVLETIKNDTDVTWIFLNSAKLAGAAENEKTPLASVRAYQGRGGYCQDGKKEIIRMHRIVDGNILFSSSNVYLRSEAVRVSQGCSMKNMCNHLTFAFASAAQGAAYVAEEIYILAGGEITWSASLRDVWHRYYNEALMNIANWGYSRKEAKSLVRYRMCNERLALWFDIFWLMIKRNPLGVETYKRYWKLMPLTTLAITLFSPLIAIYVFLRSNYRKRSRRMAILKYKHESGAKPEILKHCQ